MPFKIKKINNYNRPNFYFIMLYNFARSISGTPSLRRDKVRSALRAPRSAELGLSKNFALYFLKVLARLGFEPKPKANETLVLSNYTISPNFNINFTKLIVYPLILLP